MRTLLVVAMIGVTAVAQAQPSATSSSAPNGSSYVPPPEPEPLYREPDYRWQMAVSDLASISLAATGTRTGVGLGLFGYAFGGPLIHDLNADSSRAGASFALRVLAPLVGGLAFDGVARLGTNCRRDDDDCDESAVAATALGAVVGATIALLVDDLYIARPRKIYARTVSLTAHVDHDQASLGLAGRF